MPIEQLVNQTINRLNLIMADEEWISDPWFENDRPWARIFNGQMLHDWPANGQNPAFWFEIKCVNSRADHYGGDPYTIYITRVRENQKGSQKAIECLAHMRERLAQITDQPWRQSLEEVIEVHQEHPEPFQLDPKIVLNDDYADTAIGYILWRKQLFI